MELILEEILKHKLNIDQLCDNLEKLKILIK